MTRWSNLPRFSDFDAEHLEFFPDRREDSLTFLAQGRQGSEWARVTLDEGGDHIAKVIFRKMGRYDNGEKEVTILENEAKHILVGERNWRRDVYHYLMPGGPAPTMRLGITHHRGEGTWSSLPHDFELNLEFGFEEVFFHILSGGLDGREPIAWQRGKGVWYDGTKVDDMWPVKNYTFSTIPMGYHPVVGEPGVSVSYVWCYLAKHKHWEKI